ncbi:phage tail assembly protein [Leisingera sp. MMG026]|uniref:phage tail assembly protein n=1 Tax=Leisingera sp. MMG026 TaxID=2909982 RepID=UPI001F3A0214|nr:phage tail assembly protein [Leisingera sp. MMG026]MCF6432510.1 phage tail assembly protein [Leisingera sp. MMG026]
MSTVIDRNKNFVLQYPITYKGEDISEITLRRPKMADVKKLSSAKGDVVAAAAQTVADLAGKPIALIDELDPEDYAPMQEWAHEVLGKLSPE